MDNFLTTLYFEYFRSIEEEKRLRKITDFGSDSDNIRNDQKITNIKECHKKLEKLIEAYIRHTGG